MGQQIVLVFPPATDPRSPHLALPALTAFLRQAGVRVRQIDADLEGMLALLHPAAVAEAVRACRHRFRRLPAGPDQAALGRLLGVADYVAEHIGATPALLRTPATFYNPHTFMQARECINRALDLTSLANAPVQYNVVPSRYDVAGFNASRVADLDALTADPRYNLFHSYYQDVLLPSINQDAPAVVGISILNYQQVVPGLALARALKAQGHFVVIGGTLYSKFVTQLLQNPAFFRLFCDGIIPYEGETALLELLNQVTTGARDFAKVPNYIYLNALGVPTMGRTHLEDVANLPTPDFSDLPLGQYLTPEPVLPILTGKGCYFNLCKFCDIPFINSISKKKYRVRAAERVAADVVHLNERYGVRHFQVTDESMSPALLLGLAEAMEPHQHLNARFVGYARLEPGFTAEACRRIYQLGVRKLFFGLESGSQKMLDHMNKGIDMRQVPQVLQNCSDAGIAFHLFSIVGFPEETAADARETLDFFLNHKPLLNHPRNSFDVHPFMLDLRTDYSSKAAQYGIEIDEATQAQSDFPLSVAAWQNTRGLDEAAVAGLLDEFHEALREAYPEYRQFPAHLWPSFEEHALLYADAYADRPFGYRFNLPAPGDDAPFALHWAPSVRFRPSGADCEVTCLTGQATASTVTLKLLAGAPAAATADVFFARALATLRVPAALHAPVRAKLRRELDGLLAVGALRALPTKAVPEPTPAYAH